MVINPSLLVIYFIDYRGITSTEEVTSLNKTVVKFGISPVTCAMQSKTIKFIKDVSRVIIEKSKIV